MKPTKVSRFLGRTRTAHARAKADPARTARRAIGRSLAIVEAMAACFVAKLEAAERLDLEALRAARDQAARLAYALAPADRVRLEGMLAMGASAEAPAVGRR
jgi:hypothetical protein